MNTSPQPTVEVLGAEWCADTARTLRCLRRLRVPFSAVDVDHDLEALQESMRLSGGERRTPVVRLAGRALVEPSNETLVMALEQAALLVPSTVHAFQHGQNIGDLERVLRLAAACALVAVTTRSDWPVRLPLRVAAVALALTGIGGWCPWYDARGVTSVGGPGDRPNEAERDYWLAPTRAPAGLAERRG
ncbi:MAG: glutaredoxin family protein [Luteitalea sp.]